MDDETCSEGSAPDSVYQDPTPAVLNQIPTIVNQLVDHVALIRSIKDELKDIREGMIFTNECIGELRSQVTALQKQLADLATSPDHDYELLHGDDI
jgi:hypothetical protein